MKLTKTHYFYLIGTAVGLAVLLALYLKSPKFEEKNNGPKLLSFEDCDLSLGSCEYNDDTMGKLRLTLNPLPKLNQELFITLESDSPLTNVQADLLGLDMDMGYNRPELKNEFHSPLTYQGETYLPTCVADSMNWELTLLFTFEGNDYALKYRFIAKK